MIIISTAALAFYQALNSVTVSPYTGAGYQNNDFNPAESIVLLAIFFLGVSRLVIDLRGREEF